MASVRVSVDQGGTITELDLFLPEEVEYNSDVLCNVLGDSIDLSGKSLEVYNPPFSAWVPIEAGLVFGFTPPPAHLDLEGG